MFRVCANGNHLVGSFLRGFRTTGLLVHVRRLERVSGNPKRHRDPFLDEILIMILRETVKVLWTFMRDEIDEVPKVSLHSLTNLSVQKSGYVVDVSVPEMSDYKSANNKLQ